MHTDMTSKFQRTIVCRKLNKWRRKPMPAANISRPGYVLMTLTDPTVWAVQIVTSLKKGLRSDWA